MDGRTSHVSAALSENKLAQTDLTYAVRNKKIQTVRIDESDSDDDPDIANQSLSQSMMLVNSSDARAFGLKSFNEPGFANLAMQTLVRDELRNRSRMSQLTDDASSSVAGGELERSTVHPRGHYHHYSRPTETDIAEEGGQQTDRSHRTSRGGISCCSKCCTEHVHCSCASYCLSN